MGTAVLEYTLGAQHSHAFISGVSSLAAAGTLAQTAAAQSGATLSKVAFTQQTTFEASAPKAADFDLSEYALLYFRDADDHRFSLAIPSPLVNIFETVNGNHTVKKPIGDALAEALSTATGHEIAFRHGGLVSRNITNY